MAANQAVEVDVSPGLSSSDTRDGLENEDETADSDSRLNSVPPMLSNCLDHDASNESPSVSPAVEDDATPSQCLKEREFDQDALNSEQHSPEVESTAMNSTSATDETGAEGDGVNCRNVSETERSLLQEALNGSNPLTKSSGDDVAVINHAQSKAIQSRNFSMRSTASSSSTSNNHGNELGLNQEASTTGLSKELRDNAMESCGTEASTSSKMMRKTVGKSNEANTQDTNDQQKPKKSISPIPDDPDVTIVQEKPRAAVTAQSLLNRIEATVLLFARAEGNNNQRKLTDVIMQALNQEVQRDPQGVQKILADKELRLPTAVTIPPSQVVDLLVEYEPDVTLRRVLTKLYGDLKIKITDNERKERDHLRQTTPAPHMARLMLSIGQDLVQEATYSDIVHARNLPEAPRNEDTYKQVAAQLRPVLDALRAKNEPYKTKTHRCHLCSFRSDSLLVLAQHKHMPHNDGRKFLCALCPDFDTSERRIRKHYLKKHNIIATEEDHGPRAPCPCCDMDFQYKGQRDMHLKSCKRNYVRDRLAPTADDVATVSRWLWEKPPEPLVNHPFAVQAPPTARPGQLPYSHGLRLMSLAPAGPGVSTQRMVVPAGGTTGPRFLSNSRLLAPFQQHQQPQSAQQQQQNAINAAAQQQRIQQLLVQRQQNSLGSPQFPPITGIRAVGNALTPRMPVRPPNKPIEPRPATHAKTLAEALAVHPVDRQNRPIPAALYAQHQVRQPLVVEQLCEICDQGVQDREKYLAHLQLFHKQMQRKTAADMAQGAPLACSRCRDRFWTYEGLERHLVMGHGLVTSDLLAKAQKKEDGGRCKLCAKQYAFNMLQHLVTDHQLKLCSAEIMYSCDVCSFKCTGYTALEEHLNVVHPHPLAAQSSAPVNQTPLPPPPAARQEVQKQPEPQKRVAPTGQHQPFQSALAAANQLKRPMTTAAMPATALMGAADSLPPTNAEPAAKRPTKPKVKYTCTPCDLRFEQYSEVIAHWQRSHLKKAVVQLCRIDCCPVHREEALTKYDCKFVFPEPSGPSDDVINSVITLD